MPDYKQSKIYTITRENYIYIGSTTLLLKYRFSLHQTQKTCSMYKYINENYDGNWNEWKIKLYENYPCNNKKELDRKEGDIIRLFKNDITYNVINKRIEGRTTKEWIEDNEEHFIKTRKKYHNNRKEIRKQYDKDNKDKINETRQKYREENREKIRAKDRERNSKKVICDCGCIIARNHLLRHQATQRHKDLMETQISAILFFLECL